LRRGYNPENERTPRATDCYRFVLSHPSVHVCISGTQDLKQTRENLKILEMEPMTEKELGWMRRVGDHIYHRR